jgi:O-glycosyl hydrolase
MEQLMQRTRFFIDSDRDKWIIRPEGSKRPLRSFRTKREAIAMAAPWRASVLAHMLRR